jgi:putative Holliday junction resolvase
MKSLGVDLGERRIGIAVSDPSGTLASPLSVIVRSGDAERDRAEIAALAQAEGVEAVVVGVPVSMDGCEREAARRAREEARALGGAIGLEVETWDERLTTVQAARRLAEGGTRARRSRSRIDAAAAAVMLQGWLDARRRIAGGR